MRSAARAVLSRLMAEHGVDGMLVFPKWSAVEGRLSAPASVAKPPPPPGSIAFPPCQCPEHREGRGRADTDVRLGVRGVGGARRGGGR